MVILKEAHGTGHAAFNHGPGRFRGQGLVDLFASVGLITFSFNPDSVSVAATMSAWMEEANLVANGLTAKTTLSFLVPSFQCPVLMVSAIIMYIKTRIKAWPLKSKTPATPMVIIFMRENIAGAQQQQKTGDNADG